MRAYMVFICNQGVKLIFFKKVRHLLHSTETRLPLKMLMLRRRGVRELFVVSNGFFKFEYQYSTISTSDGAATAKKAHSMVDYLINSLRFSREEAISISSVSKVTHLTSTTNPDSVVGVFKYYGFDEAQIREIVYVAPKILTIGANKTLEPKMRVFRELGLSGSDLVNLIKKNRSFFDAGLDSKIVPTINYLRQFLGSDERVIHIIKNCNWLFSSPKSRRNLSANIMLLQDYGFSDEDVVKFFLRKPRLPNLTPEWLKGRLDCVEEKLGIARSSPNFKYAAMVAFCYKESTMEKKKQVFGSFGWSESEVSTLLSINPLTLTKSEAAIRDKLNFFMVELGYTPSYLIRYNIFLVLSLEKRVKPRYEVWKILKEKKLVGSKLFVTVAKYSEPKFLEFVQRFENEVPCLSKTCISSRS